MQAPTARTGPPVDGYPATYARGVRRPYAALPAAVRAWCERELGGPVLAADDAVGGFSPGTAAVLRTAGGTGFVKAVSDVPNPTALELYQGERRRYGALPDHPGIVKPLADADLVVGAETYSLALFPALAARPAAHPWTGPTATRVFDALGELSDVLQVSVDDRPSELDGSEQVVHFFDHWPQLAADPEDPWAADHWLAARLPRILTSVARMQAAMPGPVPAHTDLRADNVLVSAAGVWFVDWAAAQTAARWVDPAILACDLVVSLADSADGGGLDVWSFLRSHPTTAEIDPELLWSMVVALGGALHRLGRRPEPPGLPTLRGWQRRCADTLMRFAARTADRF